MPVITYHSQPIIEPRYDVLVLCIPVPPSPYLVCTMCNVEDVSFLSCFLPVIPCPAYGPRFPLNRFASLALRALPHLAPRYRSHSVKMLRMVHRVPVLDILLCAPFILGQILSSRFTCIHTYIHSFIHTYMHSHSLESATQYYIPLTSPSSSSHSLRRAAAEPLWPGTVHRLVLNKLKSTDSKGGAMDFCLEIN